ncbi:unnamed protein product [Calicophoron daubneyi]|uniref:Coiled-coil domain-containing protein 6 n=1 Tax=Calicophoron daubneyi TaxID=300641 RepID=A0AAV2TUE6_CALDB
MADSASEIDLESDTSSVDAVKETMASNEQLMRRVESLQQENRVLKTEVETLKLKIKGLNEANEQLRRNSVTIQAKAEQEEEYISNILLKKITELKKEKESLAINYEQEEECLTNELNRKFTQLRQEKVALERTLAREQEDQVSKLKSRIEKLETDMNNKQSCLDRLRREKIELENALEQEQEALVNRLWKKMEKLETEKRALQEKLESLGALLSGSSSNQSLASAPHLSASGNDSMSAGTGGILMTGQSGTPSRPTSSGPGSLRGSLRHHPHPQHSSSVAASLQQPSVIIGPPTPNHQSSTAICLGRPPPPPIPIAAMGDPRPDQAPQLNQSSSLPSGFPPSKSNNGDFATCPPQSPMDVDALVHGDPGSSESGLGGSSVSCPQPVKSPATPSASHKMVNPMEANYLTHSTDLGVSLDSNISVSYVNRLRDEVCRLRKLLEKHQEENAAKMPLYESEERSTIEENRRLRKMLQDEKERREALSRQLSESESSLEMEDERLFNEACRNPRLRTTSDSTSPFHPPGGGMWPVSNPLYGPGHAYAAAVASSFSGQASLGRYCRECGQRLPSLQVDEGGIPPTCSASMGRAIPTSLHTTVNHTSGSRIVHGRCSPPVSPGRPYHGPLPTSPATPTTGSSSGHAFAKPISRVPPVVSSSDRSSFATDSFDRDSYLQKRLSAYSSSEQLFVDVRLEDVQPDPEDDDDEDARCATPPVCQPDSTK